MLAGYWFQIFGPMYLIDCLETVFLHDMGYNLRVASGDHIGCFCLKYIVKRCRKLFIKKHIYENSNV